MGYILIATILVLLFAILHFFTELGNREKISIVSALAFIVLFGYFYNVHTQNLREHIIDIQVAFKQGKTLKCGKYDVNYTNFTYSVGTSTFIGKKDTPHYSKMIDSEICQ